MLFGILGFGAAALFTGFALYDYNNPWILRDGRRWENYHSFAVFAGCVFGTWGAFMTFAI